MGGIKGQATFALWVDFVPRYISSLYRGRFVVGVVWLAVLVLGFLFGSQAITRITSDLYVMENRPMPTYMIESLRATGQLEAKFPTLSGEKAIIRVHRDDGGFVLSDQTYKFSEALKDSVARFQPEGMLLGVDSIYNYWKPTWASDEPPAFIKELFLIDGDSSMLLIIYLNMSYTLQLDYVVASVTNMVTLADLENLAAPIRYSSVLGGDLMMRLDLALAVERDAAFVHSLTLPIAMVLLMLYFRSLKIMLIPLVTIMVSIFATLLLMYVVSLVLPLHYLVPGLLTCITLACSIDYCLFFISRLKDEVSDRKTPMTRAIEISTANAGYSIMTSGVGLALGFLALCLFPVDALLVTGLATSISIVIIIAINLTVIPTMLISWPQFWEDSWTRGDCFAGWELPTIIRPEVPAYEDAKGEALAPGAAPKEQNTRVVSWWSAFGWFVIGHKGALITVGVLLLLAVIPAMFCTVYTSSPQVVFPNGYASMDFARELIDSYGEGRIWPTYLILEARNGSVLSDEFFAASARFLRAVNHTLANAEIQSVIGLMYLDNEFQKWSDLQELLRFADGDCGAREREEIKHGVGKATTLVGASVGQTASSLSSLLSGAFTAPEPARSPRPSQAENVAERMGLAFGQSLRAAGQATANVRRHPETTIGPAVGKLSTTVGLAASSAERGIVVGAQASGALCLNVKDMLQGYVYQNRSTVVMVSMYRPFGQEMAEWMLQLTDSGELDPDNFPELEYYIAGWGINYLSLQMYTLSWFPLIVLITGTLISLVLFLSYWSVVLAVRSAVTNMLSIGFVFGVLSLVYSDTVGVTWLVPLVTFSILVGLNMDYDVFLITGILEGRSAGLSTEAAIVRAMEVNGNVIGVAGMIMAIAFSGLLFSSTVMNQQLALVMVVGVVFDVVFMQSMFVPSVMAYLGDFNWWPMRFPPPDEAAGVQNGEADTTPLQSGERSDATQVVGSSLPNANASAKGHV